MVVDITRLKEAEKAVTESEEKYRSVIEQSYNGVVLSNEEGKIIEWNRSMEEITGLAENEVHGKYLSTIILQSLPPMFKSHLASHLKEDLSRIYRDQEVPPSFKKLEYSFQRPDGQERFVEALNFPIKSGGKFFMCTLIRDISRQKIAEEMTQDHLQKLIILNKIVNIANNAQNIYDLFKGVLNSTLHLLGFESGSIYLLDENKEFAELEYYENLPEEFLEKVEKLEVAREPYSSIYLEGKAFYNYLKVRPVLKEFGFKAVAVVPFFSAQKVIGSIHVVSREKNSISSLEMDILETIGMETGTVIVKMYSEAAIRDSLAEKEVLLKEIHHRVKNNMQIISSLLNLQLQHVQEEEASNVLIESQGRVKTMAMIHEKLYQSPDLTRIRFRDYIQKLAYDILYTYGVKAGSIELEMDIDNIELGMETSIPCGLIINELVTNSVKYAFPEGKGTIIIQFKGQDELQLIIKDDGIGLPREIDLEHTETLGLQLVLNLVKQLNGELTINRSQGTEYIIKFKELQYSKRF
jgi:PAS domain S-box-containing protein